MDKKQFTKQGEPQQRLVRLHPVDNRVIHYESNGRLEECFYSVNENTLTFRHDQLMHTINQENIVIKIYCHWLH